MDAEKLKNGLPVINAQDYNADPERYELRRGDAENAPSCPFGNRYEWIGFDKHKMRYIRVTKSVFKKLIRQKDDDR